jgi:hypothetical protein
LKIGTFGFVSDFDIRISDLTELNEDAGESFVFFDPSTDLIKRRSFGLTASG